MCYIPPMDTSLLDPEDQEDLPPEMLLDPNNPLNDPYYKSLNHMRALAVHAAEGMKPNHVLAAKLHIQGNRNKEVAKTVRMSQANTSVVLKRPDVLELIKILRYTAALIDGPNLEQRRNMLWRISRMNELNDPGMSIQAVKELNKLGGSYPVQTQQTNPNINITINQKHLPKTELDKPL